MSSVRALLLLLLTAAVGEALRAYPKTVFDFLPSGNPPTLATSHHLRGCHYRIDAR